MTLIACELARRGRLLVGEPFFEQGLPITVASVAQARAAPGELVLVDAAGGRGGIVERLGSPRDIHSVLAAYASEQGVRRVFSDAAEHAAERIAPDPPPPRGSRRDLRDQLAFTIDPGTAKDHDDAIAIVADGDGVRVFVHIADVTSVVAAAGAIDTEARSRGFSVYLPGRVDPMLPSVVSAGRLSLVAGAARDVVTVELRYSGSLDAAPARFYRSQITSRARLSYDEVDVALTTGSGLDGTITAALLRADRLARALRDRRAARGALIIAAREAAIGFDDRTVSGVSTSGQTSAHRLVEELMLAANIAVATRLVATGHAALFRVHRPPQPAAVHRLYDQLADLDVPTPPLAAPLAPTAAARSVAAAAADASRYATATRRGRAAFTELVLRSVMQAAYTATSEEHSGIATGAYCHFTSPIRRYADVTAHRALLASIGEASEPDTTQLGELAVLLSDTERAYAVIERRGAAICFATLAAQWQRADPTAVYDGEVTGLIRAGLFVRFATGLEGFLPARRVSGGPFEPSPLATSLVGATGTRIRLGDPVTVLIDRADPPRGRVTLSCVR